jgi:hypothetical protein
VIPKFILHDLESLVAGVVASPDLPKSRLRPTGEVIVSALLAVHPHSLA